MTTDEIFSEMRARQSRPDRSDQANFQRGEFIQLYRNSGDPADQNLRLFDLKLKRHSEIAREAMPWVAKFICPRIPGHCEVEFPKVPDGRTLRYQVKREFVFALTNGRAQILRSVLSVVHFNSDDFARDENVRYRDASGVMREGHHPVKAAPDEVFFKWTDGAARSIYFNSAQLTNTLPHAIPVERPTKFLREFLNAAARFSAIPEFKHAPFSRRLELIVAFQNIILPQAAAGDTLEFTGLTTMSEVLCAGAGRCRHSAPLMAAVLSEAGLNVRIVHRVAGAAELARRGETHFAHVWLEVDGPGGVVYVVDPANRAVKSLVEAERNADVDPESLDAWWWAHAERESLALEYL